MPLQPTPTRGGAMAIESRGTSTRTTQPGTEVAWTAMASLADLRGDGPFALTADGLDIVAVRTATGLKAFQGRCPHQGALLGEGELDGDALVCRNHRWRYAMESGMRQGGPACLVACPVECAGASCGWTPRHCVAPKGRRPRLVSTAGSGTFRDRPRCPSSGTGIFPAFNRRLFALVPTLQGSEAVAVCFLHSYANPDHERRAAAIQSELEVRARDCAQRPLRRLRPLLLKGRSPVPIG